MSVADSIGDRSNYVLRRSQMPYDLQEIDCSSDYLQYRVVELNVGVYQNAEILSKRHVILNVSEESQRQH